MLNQEEFQPFDIQMRSGGDDMMKPALTGVAQQGVPGDVASSA